MSLTVFQGLSVSDGPVNGQSVCDRSAVGG